MKTDYDRVNPFPKPGGGPDHQRRYATCDALAPQTTPCLQPLPASAAEVFAVTLSAEMVGEGSGAYIDVELCGTWSNWLPQQEALRPFKVHNLYPTTMQAVASESARLTPDDWLNHIVQLGGRVSTERDRLACAVNVSEVFPFTVSGQVFDLPPGHAITYRAEWNERYRSVSSHLAVEGMEVRAKAPTIDLAILHLRHAYLLHIGGHPPQNQD